MNPTEPLAPWELELLLPTIADGDLVKLTKGEEKIEGRARVRGSSIGVAGTNVRGRARSGWTVTVVEKAKPPLPTEPGVYLDRDGDAWIIRRATGSKLTYIQNGSSSTFTPEEFAPFVKLEKPAQDAEKAEAPAPAPRYRVVTFYPLGSFDFGQARNFGVEDTRTGDVASFGVSRSSADLSAGRLNSGSLRRGTLMWRQSSRCSQVLPA